MKTYGIAEDHIGWFYVIWLLALSVLVIPALLLGLHVIGLFQAMICLFSLTLSIVAIIFLHCECDDEARVYTKSKAFIFDIIPVFNIAFRITEGILIILYLIFIKLTGSIITNYQRLREEEIQEQVKTITRITKILIKQVNKIKETQKDFKFYDDQLKQLLEDK